MRLVVGSFHSASLKPSSLKSKALTILQPVDGVWACAAEPQGSRGSEQAPRARAINAA